MKEIELTSLQLKAIRFAKQEPEDYLEDKIKGVLKFTIDQAKQILDRISPMTEEEIEELLDEIEPE